MAHNGYKDISLPLLTEMYNHTKNLYDSMRSIAGLEGAAADPFYKMVWIEGGVSDLCRNTIPLFNQLSLMESAIRWHNERIDKENRIKEIDNAIRQLNTERNSLFKSLST